MTYYTREVSTGRIFDYGNKQELSGGQYEQLPSTKGAALFKAQTIKELVELFGHGQTVYTLTHYVSSNGMKKRISFFIIKNNEWLDITYRAGIATNYMVSKDRGLIVGGDGAHDVIAKLERVLDKAQGTRFELNQRII